MNLKTSYAVVSTYFSINNKQLFYEICNNHNLNFSYRLTNHFNIDGLVNLELELFTNQIKLILTPNQTFDLLKHKHFVETSHLYSNNITYFLTEHYRVSNVAGDNLLTLINKIKL